LSNLFLNRQLIPLTIIDDEKINNIIILPHPNDKLIITPVKWLVWMTPFLIMEGAFTILNLYFCSYQWYAANNHF
jgi:hypothetical protein